MRSPAEDGTDAPHVEGSHGAWERPGRARCDDGEQSWMSSMEAKLRPALIHMEVNKKTWELLERDSLLPEGGRPKYLLWAFIL